MPRLWGLAILLVIGISGRLSADNPPAVKPPPVTPPTVAAPTATRPSVAIGGHWLGTLKIQGFALRMAVTIRAKPDGSLNGTLNSLDQGAIDYPLDEVSLQDRKVRLVLKISRLTIEGPLNAAGTEIDARFKQSGGSLPLIFKKVDRAVTVRNRPQEPKRPFPYHEENVTYENKAGHAKLAGTLSIPRSAGRFPAVLLITGSGQQDRDEMILGHRPFLVLADYLTRRGIAVLRVDDRGVGGSTGDVKNATSEDFASDVMAGIAYLKSRSEIDPHRIGLAGHSEGGLIAPMVARRSPDVAFIVLLAGPGLPGDQIIYLQQAAISRKMGVSTPVIALNRVVNELLITAIKRETDPAAPATAPAQTARAQTAPAQKSKPLADSRGALPPHDDKKPMPDSANPMSQLVKRVGSPWFRFFVKYDPRPALRQVQCPVLAVIGEKDIQVPAKENLPEIEKALRAGGNKDFTVKELPHLNHLFQTCQTGNIDEYARIEETFAPSALELIADWIGTHTR